MDIECAYTSNFASTTNNIVKAELPCQLMSLNAKASRWEFTIPGINGILKSLVFFWVMEMHGEAFKVYTTNCASRDMCIKS
jgi:hypothetical protein